MLLRWRYLLLPAHALAAATAANAFADYLRSPCCAAAVAATADYSRCRCRYCSSSISMYAHGFTTLQLQPLRLLLLTSPALATVQPLRLRLLLLTRTYALADLEPLWLLLLTTDAIASLLRSFSRIDASAAAASWVFLNSLILRTLAPYLTAVVGTTLVVEDGFGCCNETVVADSTYSVETIVIAESIIADSLAFFFLTSVHSCLMVLDQL